VTEQIWRGCVVPDDLLYDVEMNVWVRLEGSEAVLGMTDIAQAMGGRVVQVTWRRSGRVFTRGRPLAVIESAKWVGPFPTPLTGELLASNESAFAADVAIANRDPYGAGWLARLRPSALEQERAHLLDASAAYARFQDFINANDVRCYRCVD
jgi:glycine cleavage system H protein